MGPMPYPRSKLPTWQMTSPWLILNLVSPEMQTPPAICISNRRGNGQRSVLFRASCDTARGPAGWLAEPAGRDWASCRSQLNVSQFCQFCQLLHPLGLLEVADHSLALERIRFVNPHAQMDPGRRGKVSLDQCHCGHACFPDKTVLGWRHRYPLGTSGSS